MKQTHSLTYTAIGVAILTVLSQITIPLGPVPFTLQTLAVGLIATFYRPKEALSVVALYLLLGGIGIPVFAGFSGGFASLVSPTAGFLWGFLLYAGITSRLTSLDSHMPHVFLANILGNTACFVVGILVFKWATGANWSDTLAWTTIPFLIPELIKLSLVTTLHHLSKSSIKKTSLGQS